MLNSPAKLTKTGKKHKSMYIAELGELEKILFIKYVRGHSLSF